MRTPYTQLHLSHDESEPEVIRSVMLEKYERCTFCASKLIFSHDLNISTLQVIETSRCPGCGVSTQPKKFTLQ